MPPADRSVRPDKLRRRDPHATKKRILEAARAEFAARGFSGARVDAIAARARVNKRLLYHYFGNKRDLFRAVVQQTVDDHGTRVAGNPTDPIDAMPAWYDAMSADIEWTRLLGWEALEDVSGSVGAQEMRRNYEGAVGWVRATQAQGLVSDRLDPELFLLTTIALDMFPQGFPQITRSVTALDPSDPRFRRRWRRHLVEIGRHLRPLPSPVRDGDP